MLFWRIASSFFGIPLILGAFYLGGWYATILVLLLASLGVSELLQMQKNAGLTLSLPLTLLCTAILILATHFKQPLPFYFTGCLLLILAYQLFFSSIDSALTATGAHLLAVFYVAWLFSYAIRLNQWYYQLIFWLLFINWGSDILAYAVGLLWGKHPLAPRISPKKTIEGGIGAVLGGILGAILGWQLFYADRPVILALTLGLALGVGGQVGDLVESMFKRATQVKDSGKLIPGHGGILDRFDSLLFNLPLMYYILQLYNYLGLGKPL